MSDDRTSESEEREKKVKAVVDALWNFDPEVKLNATTPMPLKTGLALVGTKEDDHYILTGRSPSPCWEQNIIKAHQANNAYRDAEAERKRKVAAAWSPIIVSLSTVALGILALVARLLGAW